jgi:hypothetical protein
MSSIVEAIQPRNFEVIRDRIAFILADELAAQALLQPAEKVLDATVWLERFINIDKEEVPAIIVYTNNVDYDSQYPTDTRGQDMYHIDCYVKRKHAGTDNDGQGDSLASKDLSRLMGVIQYILSSENYATLGFAPGLVQSRNVKGFLIDRVTGVADGTHLIKGRVEFQVNANESVNDPSSVDIGDAYSEFLIDESDKGYQILVQKT